MHKSIQTTFSLWIASAHCVAQAVGKLAGFSPAKNHASYGWVKVRRLYYSFATLHHSFFDRLWVNINLLAAVYTRFPHSLLKELRSI